HLLSVSFPTNPGGVPTPPEAPATDAPGLKQSVLIPDDALLPQPTTGRLVPVGPGQGATAKVLYRLRASSFSDDSAMEAADLLYPYALAFRWGAAEQNAATHDPEIAAATRLMRERLRGVKLIRVEETRRV